MVWNGTYVTNLLQIKYYDEGNSLPFKEMVGLALRKNPKRAHLLVSKILGKHIPVDPTLLLNAGQVLALKVQEKLVPGSVTNMETVINDLRLSLEGDNEASNRLHQLLHDQSLNTDAIVFGYAETATGLGATVAHMLNAPYIHSTRYPHENANYYGAFEEEHSHATSHHVTPLKLNFFENTHPMVLVDDELTTGSTVINTIRSLQDQQPRNHYVVATYLDLRTTLARNIMKQFAQEIGVTISVVSLYSGELMAAENSLALADRIITTVSESIKTYPAKAVISQHRINLADLSNGESKTGVDNLKNYELAGHTVAHLVAPEVHSEKVLVLGIEEEMFLPIMVANELKNLGKAVMFSSSTRSPVFAIDDEGYAIRDKIVYHLPEGDDGDSSVRYVHNIGTDFGTIILVLKTGERFNQLGDLIRQLKTRTGNIIIMNYSTLPQPLIGPEFGSYTSEDVKWLLKDLSNVELEMVTEEREEAIQSGGAHYAESLPIEYQPTTEYQDLFKSSLTQNSEKLAIATGVVAEKIIKARRSPVLVSLARAGTPVGILIKRYIKHVYRVNVPHYAVSIVRGKGIDVNALTYLAEHYHPEDIIFIDGWTGKGAIVKELDAALAFFEEQTGIKFSSEVAVLADPGSCVTIFGTRDDYLIPSACLNSTVSGLVSRTVLNADLIGPNDYHGAKFYKSFADNDYSNYFVDTVSSHFGAIKSKIREELKTLISTEPTWEGWATVERINNEYGIGNVNLVKPGVGETTRVLLRRVPWKILIRKDQYDNLAHIRVLADERGTPIEVVDDLAYSCVGLIHPKFTRGATGFDGEKIDG